MKYLKQASETLAKTPERHLQSLQTYATSRWNTRKNMCETPENTWNICWQHACICNIQIYFCNIQIKHLQHSFGIDEYLEHTLKTYMYSHYNMCNISIYFYNINIQHLQHTSKISKTYYCNIRFQRSIYLLLGRMEACRRRARRGAEVDAVEWHGGRQCGARWRHEPRQGQG
jgi:hypothetical protein